MQVPKQQEPSRLGAVSPWQVLLELQTDPSSSLQLKADFPPPKSSASSSDSVKVMCRGSS